MSAPTGREPWTPVEIEGTSATERATFRRCKRQWLLTVVHRLEPALGNPNFWFGDLIHSGLEAYYRAQMQGSPWEAREAAGLAAYEDLYVSSLGPIRAALGFLWDRGRQAYEDQHDLGLGMLEGYFERERARPLFDEVVAVEERAFVPIRTLGGWRVGTLAVRADAVGRRDGRLRAVDHKTASSAAGSQYLDIDDQLTAEVYAVWRDLGEFPEEAVYNALVKRVPQPPRLLAPTRQEPVRLSRDKSQGTTYDLFVRELRRWGLPLSAYTEVLFWLREQEAGGESAYFVREGTFRTPGQMAQFEANLYWEFRDMQAAARRPERAYPSPSPFSCPGCPVRQVCAAMMDGSDAGAVIEAGFTVGEPRFSLPAGDAGGL